MRIAWLAFPEYVDVVFPFQCGICIVLVIHLDLSVLYIMFSYDDEANTHGIQRNLDKYTYANTDWIHKGSI